MLIRFANHYVLFISLFTVSQLLWDWGGKLFILRQQKHNNSFMNGYRYSFGELVYM